MASPDTLIDGNWLAPDTTGARRFRFPFRANGDLVSGLFDEDYWQTGATYAPEKFGTPHPALRDFYFIAETDPSPGLAELQAFTRTFARIPAQQIDYSNLSLTKPTPAGTDTAIQQIGSAGAVTNLNNGSLNTGYLYSPDTFAFYNADTVITCTNPGAAGQLRLNWTAHGVTTQDIQFGDATRWLVSSPNYTIIDADHIDLQGGFSTSAGNVTRASKKLRAYTPGLAMLSCKLVSDFYLPGVSSGITTAADLPIPADLLNPDAFISAALANPTGYVSYQLKNLDRWLGSPIYRRDTIQLNFADL